MNNYLNNCQTTKVNTCSQPVSPIDHSCSERAIKRGFALISSLMIMMLLMLVALAMMSLSSNTTRSASIDKGMSEARANARMALMIAIGELQNTLGPDKRISARGVTLAKHEILNIDEDDLPPSASAKAWWVGAASSDKDETIGYENRDVVWLVSGLDPTATSKAQIGSASPFTEKITMFGGESIDLLLTGGQPLKAGKISILNTEGTKTGSYAYFIDDNGMKAQLSASHPDVVNTDVSTERPGGTVIPGSFDLGVLKADGMDALAGNVGNTIGNYMKINSINDLPFLGGATQISRNKRLSYTSHSYGVLSDVKKGGLKKDLTIAFENHEIDTTAAYHPNGGNYPNWPVYNVFDKVFKSDFDDSIPRDDDWGNYLVVDESKRVDELGNNEFGANGYIHWAMFRDYYNIKRYIQSSSDANKGANGKMEWLDPSVFHSTVAKNTWNIIPPHQFGPDGGGTPFLLGGTNVTQGFPYSNYLTGPNNSIFDKEFLQYYKHSPVIPIMSKLQVNAWLSQGDIQDTSATTTSVDAIKTNFQAFTSYYNPYNIGLRYQDPQYNTKSFHSYGFPRAAFYFPNTSGEMDIVNRKIGQANMAYNYRNDWWSLAVTITGEDNFFGTNKGAPVYVGPGRAMTVAIAEDVDIHKNNKSVISYTFQDLIDKSRYGHYDVTKPIPAILDLDLHIGAFTTLGIGVQQQSSGGGYDTSQKHGDAFARDKVRMADWRTSPGVIIDVPSAALGFNTMGSMSYRLRSTTEPDGNSIRPLVDANIRALLVNPRWDSSLAPLGLDTSAAYLIDDDPDMGQVPQMLPDTDGEGSPTGYTYWGSSDTTDGFDKVVLFDIPRQDLVSIGQLQHANAGRFSYEPSYIVGNSYANPRIKLDSWKDSISDNYATAARGFNENNAKIKTPFDLYDASYLVNEVLWDSYIFTTIPQVADNYNDPSEPEVNEALFTNLLKRDEHLANPRFIPYEPSGSIFNMATLQQVGDATTQSAFYHNAGHLLVDGAFNINSTSVDAWEAFLSSTYGMPFQKMDETGMITGFEELEGKVRFPRLQTVLGEAFDTGSETKEGYWTGFRSLTSTEVRELAEEMVKQVIELGPFLSMGEFVNRKLEAGDLGEKGAIQAALDETVNKNPSGAYSSASAHPTVSPAHPTVIGENQSSGLSRAALTG